MTREEVEQVSPDSHRLRRFAKAPMLLVIAGSALCSGVTVALLKLLGELLLSGEVTEDLLLAGLVALGAFLSAIEQLHMLNTAMKYYDQLEVMPIYQTAIMMMWCITGMIVYEETQYYSAGELAAIFGALVACGIGISFLYAKTKAMKSGNRSTLGKGDKLG